MVNYNYEPRKYNPLKDYTLFLTILMINFLIYRSHWIVLSTTEKKTSVIDHKSII